MNGQTKNTADSYNLSFTAGGLLYHETLAAVTAYLECRDWEATRSKVIEDNLFGSRRLNTTKRLFWEIELRLSWLDDQELEMISRLSDEARKQILWVCICKTYRFVYEFMSEVISDKLLALDYTLSHGDYDRFFNAKAQWSEEVNKVSPSTKDKIRQVMFKMLRDMGILSKKNEIYLCDYIFVEVADFAKAYGVTIEYILPGYSEEKVKACA